MFQRFKKDFGSKTAYFTQRRTREIKYVKGIIVNIRERMQRKGKRDILEWRILFTDVTIEGRQESSVLWIQRKAIRKAIVEKNLKCIVWGGFSLTKIDNLWI